MKATLLALLAIVALPAFGHGPPRNDSYDQDGIAYTARLVANAHYYTTSGQRQHATQPIAGTIHVSVAGVAAYHGIAAGTYSVQTFCPTAVAFGPSETGSRSGLALSAETKISIRIATHQTAGAQEEEHVCWLRVIVRRNGEDEPVRVTMLPVRVVHRRVLTV